MFQSGTVEINGKEITIKEMSAGQRRDLIAKVGAVDNTELSAEMIKLCCEAYTESSVEDILNMSATDFDTLSSEVSRVSGMAGDEEEKKP